MYYFNNEELSRIKRLLTKFQKGNIESHELNELEAYTIELTEYISNEKYDRENEY